MGAGRGSVFALTLYDTDHEFEEELAFELSWMWEYGIMASKDMHPYSSLSVPQESGPQQFPPRKAPPAIVIRDSNFAPAPAPQFDSSGSPAPGLGLIPSTTGSLPGFSPASGPVGSTSGLNSAPSAASSLVYPLASISVAFLLFIIANFFTSFSL